jgi:HJR/Mrr/RecB family endonuclease
MIIQPDEIDYFERWANFEHDFGCDDPGSEDAYLQSLVVSHPHLMMPLGFDEYAAIRHRYAFESKFLSRRKRKSEDHPLIRLFKVEEMAYPYEIFFRWRESGSWSRFAGIDRKGLNSEGPIVGGEGVNPTGPTFVHFEMRSGRARHHKALRLDTLIKELRRIVDSPDLRYHQLILPSFWTPDRQKEQETLLGGSVHEILSAIAAEKRELASVSWRQLEEIVAEILREKGMEISLTPKTHDGGRDIIARGELIPGEPTLIAVEVKHKNVVSVDDIRRTLYANQSFPVIMLATSGRFSAGVVEEKSRQQNQMRVLLKDGVALREWIDLWAQSSPPKSKRRR